MQINEFSKKSIQLSIPQDALIENIIFQKGKDSRYWNFYYFEIKYKNTTIFPTYIYSDHEEFSMDKMIKDINEEIQYFNEATQDGDIEKLKDYIFESIMGRYGMHDIRDQNSYRKWEYEVEEQFDSYIDKQISALPDNENFINIYDKIKNQFLHDYRDYLVEIIW